LGRFELGSFCTAYGATDPQQLRHVHVRNRLSSFHAAAGCDPPGYASDPLCVLIPIDNCNGYQEKTENPQNREFVVMGRKIQSHERYEENFVTMVESIFVERHLSSSSIGGGRDLCSSCKRIASSDLAGTTIYYG
jgi:hypothetical protein